MRKNLRQYKRVAYMNGQQKLPAPNPVQGAYIM